MHYANYTLGEPTYTRRIQAKGCKIGLIKHFFQQIVSETKKNFAIKYLTNITNGLYFTAINPRSGRIVMKR